MYRSVKRFLFGGSGIHVRHKYTQSIAMLAVMPLCAGCFSTIQSETDAADADGLTDVARCIVPEESERMIDQVLQLVNLERADAGLAPVVADSTLQKIADDFACRMIVEEFFGHTDPENGHGPGDRAEMGKYAFYAIGENLAAGQETPAEAMRVWMESPAHRDIILDEKWSEVGLSVRFGGEFSIYWVQEFGAPAEE
jgi:uncharacterized protein YkwD